MANSSKSMFMIQNLMMEYTLYISSSLGVYRDSHIVYLPFTWRRIAYRDSHIVYLPFTWRRIAYRDSHIVYLPFTWRRIACRDFCILITSSYDAMTDIRKFKFRVRNPDRLSGSPSHKISSKSVLNFSNNPSNRQTDKHTGVIPPYTLAEVIIPSTFLITVSH